MNQSEDDGTKRAGSSDSDTKRGSASTSAPRKRASRAGTRSVNNLTNDQLERKRANDREAQRQIRQRTKETIDKLQQQVKDLQSVNQNREQELAIASARLRELEQENAYYRSRMDGSPFIVPSGDEAKTADSVVGSSSTHTSPHAGYTESKTTSISSRGARQSISAASASPASRSETWRHPIQMPAYTQAEQHNLVGHSWRPTTDLPSSMQRTTQVAPIDTSMRGTYPPSSTHDDRTQWPSQYAYMLDTSVPSADYASVPMTHTLSHQHQTGYPVAPTIPSHAHTHGRTPATPLHHEHFSPSLMMSSTDFTNLSLHAHSQPGTPLEHPHQHAHHQQSHSPYDMSAGYHLHQATMSAVPRGGRRQQQQQQQQAQQHVQAVQQQQVQHSPYAQGHMLDYMSHPQQGLPHSHIDAAQQVEHGRQQEYLYGQGYQDEH